MDIKTLLAQMAADGGLGAIATNPRSQFGTQARRYIGAELLPERPVEENAFREENIAYRTVIANHGTRYSPAQKKGGALVGSFLVELSHSDIANEFTSREYDALLRYLRNNLSQEAMASVVQWLDTTIVRALIERNEKDRWDAIVSARVLLRGDNAYEEDVDLPDPTGHRAATGGDWSDDAYDPFEDLHERAQLLASKGFTVDRIITGRQAFAVMSANGKVRTRTGVPVIASTGQFTQMLSRASLDAVNRTLAQDGLPPIELYDLQYRTATGSEFFLQRDAMVFVATTGRDQSLDLGDEVISLENTLGYTAIGRGAGQQAPGRVVQAEAKMDKPPRIEAEGWQASFPVVQEPEAVAVITGIQPGA